MSNDIRCVFACVHDKDDRFGDNALKVLLELAMINHHIRKKIRSGARYT